MAWRVTVYGIPRDLIKEKKANYLIKILKKDRYTSKKIVDWYDNKRKQAWECQCPEIVDIGPGKAMIRFFGKFMDAVYAFNHHRGLRAELGG